MTHLGCDMECTPSVSPVAVECNGPATSTKQFISLIDKMIFVSVGDPPG